MSTDADLRERMESAIIAWETESNPPERSYLERKSRGPYEEGRDDMLGECAGRLRTILNDHNEAKKGT